MKLFNRIIIGFEILCASCFLCCIVKFFITPGTGPDDILSAVDLELPNYNVENKWDNLDRGASRFDNFTYDVSFPVKGITALIKQMQVDGWEKEGDLYIKRVNVDDDLTYSAFINPVTGTATLDVLVDEDYSLIYFIYAILIVIIASLIAGLWGLARLLCKIKINCKLKNSD